MAILWHATAINNSLSIDIESKKLKVKMLCKVRMVYVQGMFRLNL